MVNVNCLNNIASVGLDLFSDDYNTESSFEDAQAVLVRSAKMHDMELGDNLLAIARAGAGVNNIPLDKCAESGIVVFNTPGANANAVKEQVLAAMLLASRDLIGGNEWVKANKDDADIAKATEKAKKAFAGQEIKGKKLGVIGLGAIGQLVANAAIALGMEVYGYDPYLSVNAAWNLSSEVKHIVNVEDIYKECNYITVHVPALDSTKGMIDKNAISLMKEGVVILNFARDVLVNQEDIVDALVAGKVHRYVTDFPTKEIVGVKGAIVIPHLGASTEESEDNCAQMAVAEIRDFLENGNITHSVNYPDCNVGTKADGDRITILHRNVPNMIGQFTTLLAQENQNIALMTNKSKKEYAYTVIDVDGSVSDEVVSKLESITDVLGVRVIK